MTAAIGERVALAAAAVVLVLASVFLAVGGPDKTATSALPVPSATPLVTVPSNAPTVSAAPAPAPSINPPIAPVATAGINPGAPTPPIAGKYVYDETDTSGETNSTLVISDDGPGRQTEVENGGGTVDNVEWGSSGKYVVSTTFRFPQATVRCNWTPALADYRFPLRAGATWTERASCHPDAKDSISVDAVANVTKSERLIVAGEPVDAWVIVVNGTLTLDVGGATSTQKIRDEDHFSPAHGITVEEILDTVTTDPSGAQTRDRLTRVVQNVAPGTSA
jgi:hypothetical protein